MVNKDKNRRKDFKLPVKSDNVPRFQIMLEAMADRDELNEVLKNRVAKACQLLDENIPLYPNDFVKSARLDQVLARFEPLDAEALEAQTEELSLAGRIVAMRSFGKAAFFHLQEAGKRAQCFISREDVGDEAYAVFKKFDTGDIVGLTGVMFRTKTGELTVKTRRVRLLSKSMRPLPEKYHGLKDVETRYRQRYVDLIVTPKTAGIFKIRSRIVSEMRRFLDERGFMEVETPMMQAIPGGATAKPFETHHNALDMKLYMRVAPELYLKRLLVGGFEKVFEIGRNFRNEGISAQHNPEFTMCEFYWAYARFEDLMDLTESLFDHLARAVCGDSKVTYQGQIIDLTVGTWKRMTFHESLEKVGNVAPEIYTDQAKAAALVLELGEKVFKDDKLGKIQAKLFDLLVEPKLIQPHFIYRYPTDISPLSRRNEADPDVTDRFELFICGREMGNAFSELNDPADQRQRFAEQAREKAAGDEEAMFVDEDYLRALEYGMPPAAGQGIGIDRLVMLLTDSASIREVILFPLLRPEGNSGE